MSELSLKNVVKRFGALEIIHGANLEVKDGEFVVFVGPSGCGKSTLLRMIAGLEDISGGEINIGGKVVNDVEPAERGIAMVFQSYALYPHMTVEENLSFGLRMNGNPKQDTEKRVKHAANILQINELMQRRPKQLSGGQRQRVAIGRAIVREPQVFLFDEPLSNLDAELRVQMRVEISRLHKQLGTTMIYVTHDQTEAMTLADKIVVLRDGNIEQVGSPREVYEDPANIFVAGFIGSPRMNMIEAEWASDGSAKVPGGSIKTDIRQASLAPGDKLMLGMRPEHLVVASDGDDAVRVTVDFDEYLGGTRYLYCQTEDGQNLIAEYREGPDVQRGDTLYLRCTPERRRYFDGQGNRLR